MPATAAADLAPFLLPNGDPRGPKRDAGSLDNNLFSICLTAVAVLAPNFDPRGNNVVGRSIPADWDNSRRLISLLPIFSFNIFANNARGAKEKVRNF